MSEALRGNWVQFAPTNDRRKLVNTGGDVIYFADTCGIQDSVRKDPPWSMAADPPSNRECR
jgi:hypothetical protein